MLRILVAGHVCVDLVPDDVERAPAPGELAPVGGLNVIVGGCVGNTGAALVRMGIRTRLEAYVGEDDLGDIAERTLRNLGAEVAIERSPRQGTSYSIVLDPPDGDRAIWHYTGANEEFGGPSNHPADLVHLGYPPALSGWVGLDGFRLVRSLKLCKATGATTSIDLSAPIDVRLRAVDWTAVLTASLPFVDVVSPSLADLRGLIPDLRDADAVVAADWLIDRGAAVALVTDGADGAAFRVAATERMRRGGAALATEAPREQSVRVRAGDGPVNRTTGAGDVATAGLLAAIVQGAPAGTWAAAAMAAASRHVAGGTGAISSS